MPDPLKISMLVDEIWKTAQTIQCLLTKLSELGMNVDAADSFTREAYASLRNIAGAMLESDPGAYTLCDRAAELCWRLTHQEPEAPVVANNSSQKG